MTTYNIGFITNDGKTDETQIDVQQMENVWDESIEMINLILSLKDEMNIKEIIYIDYVNKDEED